MKKIFLTLASLLGIFAAGAQCNPQFSWAPSPSGTFPLEISFTNTSAFTPPAHASVNNRIDFGDGFTGYNFSGSAWHNYAAPGTYNAWMVTSVYDSLSNQITCRDSVMHQVTVNYQPCYATFTATPTGPNTYSFTATAPAGTPGVVYNWNFGDGSPVVTGNPVSHTYSANTTHSVSLMSSTSGCFSAKTLSFSQTVPVFDCYSLNTSMQLHTTSPLTVSLTNNSSPSTGLIRNSAWFFGDGNSSTAFNTSHTYANPGTYNIVLVNQWRDTFNTVICADSAIQSYTLYPPASMCDSLDAYMNVTVTGPLSINLQNASVTIAGLSNHAQWYLGDGTTSTASNLNHTYASASAYGITLVNQWKDSANNVVCTDSMFQQVVLGNPAGNNVISGYIAWDSLTTVPAYDTFKVWLISFDSATNILTATDSTYAPVSGGYAAYSFGAQPSGNYRIKATSTSFLPGTTGLVPTYHTSSLYWNTATQVVHTGGATTNKNIWMQTGIVTSGPGFIAGNVSLGAGRGTTTGIPGMLVFLRNSNNQLVSTAYTNADGDFRFEHLPTGAYSVYPEAINYTTTPAAVVIGQDMTGKTGIDFERTSKEILPKNITSLKDVSAYQDIKVYPNPFRGEIMIDNQAGHYSQAAFVTVTGQVVHRQAIKAGNNTIATTGLAPGVYFLLINGKEQTASMTITKQ